MLLPILLTLVVGLAVGQEDGCRRDEVGDCIDENLAHIDCTKYYVCINCQAIEAECPAGSHYDESLSLCRDPYLAECDPDYARNGSAFCVYFDETDANRLDGTINPLKYPHEFINYKSPYDDAKGYWRASHTGHFVFLMSAGAYPNTPVNMSLAGTPYAWNNVRASDHHGNDFVAREMIMKMSFKFTVAAILPDLNTMMNNIGKPSMWGGFELEEFSDDVCTFFGVSNTHQSASGIATTIFFESQMIDIRGTSNADNFNPTTGVFTAPVDGVYFFMFSTGVEAFASHRSRFVSGSTEITEMYREVGLNTGIDTMSKSIIYTLMAGETMEVQLIEGDATNNQSTILSFGGYLIDPKPPTPAAGWFVTTQQIHSGPQAPMNFENIVTTYGSVYNPTTDYVTASESGYYYMTMYSGLQAGSPIEMSMVRTNGTVEYKLIDVARPVAYQTGIDSLGRSVLVHLYAGDTVHVELSSTSVSYSDVNEHTTFSGFLLFERSEP